MFTAKLNAIWLSRLLLLAGAVTLCAGGPTAEVDHALAAQVKAAYIRHLVEFTRWPESSFVDARSPVHIGILGRDADGIGASLKAAVAALHLTIQGRALQVESYPDTLSAADARGLDVLLVTRDAGLALTAVCPLFASQPTLLVGEEEFLLDRGCMVAFSVTNDAASAAPPKVKLAIDLKAVERADLKMSFQLLRMKQVVRLVE